MRIGSLRLYPFLLLIVMALTGCLPDDSDSPIQPGAIPLPVGLQSLSAPENVSVKVMIEGEVTPRFTSDNIDISSDAISIVFDAPEGQHTFLVIFEYIDLEFPRSDGNPWELARWSSDPVTVIVDQPLSLAVEEYFYEDSDEDGISNADELIARTNPGNSDDFPFEVTVTVGAGGVISPGSQFVRFGLTASFIVTPVTGYSVSMGGTCGGALDGNTYETNEITAACTVIADFILNTYSVSATAGPNGAIDPSSRTVNHGSTTTFTVTPVVGYSTSLGGTCGGTLNGNTFTTDEITEECTVDATFSLNSYTVSTNAGVGGLISPESQIVNHGSTATFLIFLAPGFNINDVRMTGCNGTLSGGDVYTTGPITADCTVSAAFSLNSYTVTASAGEGGSIIPPSRVVEHGSTDTFTVTPDTGYSIDFVAGCNGTLAGNTYTTGSITAACSVSATFNQIEFVVTATAGPNGGINPASRLVEHGETTTFSVTPDEGQGYDIGTVTGCGGSMTDADTYTTAEITAPCTVTATFSLKNYTATATSSGPNGTGISPSSRTVSHGSTTTFNLDPRNGFIAIMGGTCGGNLVGNTYTTNAITENCTVTATFIRDNDDDDD